LLAIPASRGYFIQTFAAPDDLVHPLFSSTPFMSSAPQASVSKPSFSFARVAVVLVLAILVLGGVYVVKSREWERAASVRAPTMLVQMGFRSTTPMHLDPEYKDADGDLLADAPNDPSQFVTPEKLVFCFITSDTTDSEPSSWNQLVDFVSKRVGKPAEVIAFDSSADEIEALRDGKVHVARFNTGNVPAAVNTGGFVPFCTIGRDDNSVVSVYAQIIVPAASPIQTLADLEGRMLTFTDPGSNSGYKAALVLLKDRGLLPQRDYDFRFSNSQEKSIQGIIGGKYEAAAVASERLQRDVANGSADSTKFRVIESSKPFPPSAIGCAHKLSPELVQKIRGAFLEYTWTSTDLEKLFAGSGATKFVPVIYKSDFEWVRIIADAVRDPT
jgi:phosphonate transport system substrate-binding protein